MNLADQPIFYIDLETTGLNSNKDYILEIAVAKSSLSDPYNYKHVYHAIMAMSEIHLSLAQFDPYCFEMHTKNGLLSESYKSKRLLQHVSNDLWNLIVAPTLHEGALKPILGGAACDFDMKFLTKWFPDITKVFSHRQLNLSSIKLFCESKGMPKIPKGEAHRAKADIDETVDHLKKCDEWLKDYYVRRSKGFAKAGDVVTSFFPPDVITSEKMFTGTVTDKGSIINPNFEISLHTSEPLDEQQSEKLAEIIRLEVNKAINEVFEERDWELEAKSRRLGEFVK